MGIPRLLADGDKAWWQFWKKPEPDPLIEQFTILGLEPFTALAVIAGGLFLCYEIYAHPKWFFRGLAESLGWVVGLLSVGVVIGGVAALYTMSLGIGIGAFVIYMVFIAFIMFAANGV